MGTIFLVHGRMELEEIVGLDNFEACERGPIVFCAILLLRAFKEPLNTQPVSLCYFSVLIPLKQVANFSLIA